MISSKISKKNIFSQFQKDIFLFAKRAFLIILILILLNLFFGLFLFYKYVILSNVKEDGSKNMSLQFKETVYQSVMKKRGEINSLNTNSSVQEYADPFLTNFKFETLNTK